MLSLIVAMDENRLIGKNNTLPWHLPADLKFFKKMTSNHTVIMGRHTFESIGRALPNRRNIVLTRNSQWTAEGVDVFSSIDEVLKEITPDEKAYVIGGANLYRQALPYVEEMLITRILHTFDGDAYFPNFEEKNWDIKVIEEGVVDEKNIYPHIYMQYLKKTDG